MSIPYPSGLCGSDTARAGSTVLRRSGVRGPETSDLAKAVGSVACGGGAGKRPVRILGKWLDLLVVGAGFVHGMHRALRWVLLCCGITEWILGSGPRLYTICPSSWLTPTVVILGLRATAVRFKMLD